MRGNHPISANQPIYEGTSDACRKRLQQQATALLKWTHHLYPQDRVRRTASVLHTVAQGVRHFLNHVFLQFRLSLSRHRIILPPTHIIRPIIRALRHITTLTRASPQTVPICSIPTYHQNTSHLSLHWIHLAHIQCTIGLSSSLKCFQSLRLLRSQLLTTTVGPGDSRKLHPETPSLSSLLFSSISFILLRRAYINPLSWRICKHAEKNKILSFLPWSCQR